MAKKTNTRVLLSGNEALARGAYEAGLKVACAYPGTPSTEILETLATFPEIDTQWSVNEKTAYEVAYGASVGGVRSLFACKHVGLNVAMDPLMTSVYAGVNAGFVIVVCDDPGMHSSQNEQDTRWVGVYGKLPILEPSSPAQAIDFVKEAFKISEKFDTPVIIRMTTRISHTKQDVVIGQRLEQSPAPFAVDAQKYVMVPGNARRRHLLVEERLLRLKAFSEKSKLNSVEINGSKTGFITDGVVYNYLKEMYPDASFLKLGFLYPFCDEKIKAFAGQVKKLFVVEELAPFIEEHVRSLGVKFTAKDPSYRVDELLPGLVKDIVEGRARKVKTFPARKPVLCPGCPHRAVFVALKKLDPVVTGDIGCYTLGALPPLSALHTCICMGAGITLHEGIRRARPDDKIVGVLGDSTFVHSGITGLINAVYNRCRGVIVILDNSTTAMTGGQNHPATGKTIRNQPTKQLVLEDICKSCGADNVDVVDPADVKALEKLLKERISQDALSVVITRSPCKLIDRKRKPAPAVDQELCKKCGLCKKIDCPAITELESSGVRINPELCTGCNLCVQVCPFGAIKADSGL